MRIVVTGGSGYLGSGVVPALRARGHEVLTIGRHPQSDAAVCDLTDEAAVRDAVRAVGDVDSVVHLAARAHHFRGLTRADLLRANTVTTRHLIAALRAEGRTQAVRFVHASSASVYELLAGNRAVTPDRAPYAASKLEAEKLLHAEPLCSLRVLRFAPIYDGDHMEDVARRVFVPGTRLKLRLCPPPMHSLCGKERAIAAIVAAVETPSSGAFELTNVADAEPWSQRDLVGWFPGAAIPVPTALVRVAARGLAVCGGPGLRVSRLIDKFARASVCPEAEWRAVLEYGGDGSGG